MAVCSMPSYWKFLPMQASERRWFGSGSISHLLSAICHFLVQAQGRGQDIGNTRVEFQDRTFLDPAKTPEDQLVGCQREAVASHAWPRWPRRAAAAAATRV